MDQAGKQRMDAGRFDRERPQKKHCCSDNTAEHNHTRKFMECTGDNFLTQVIEELIRKKTLLELELTAKEELLGD